MGNFFNAMKKFIPRNAFSSSLVIVKFVPCELSILLALRGRSPEKIFVFGKLFHLDWVIFLARGDPSCLVTFTFLVHFNNSFCCCCCCCSFLSSLTDFTSYYVKISLWCNQGSVLCTSYLCNFFFSYELSARIID